jgi:hypothetical protein
MVNLVVLRAEAGLESGFGFGVADPRARRGPGRDQRLAMYIVISKPKRRSQAVGVCQVMVSLLMDKLRLTRGMRGAVLL